MPPGLGLLFGLGEGEGGAPACCPHCSGCRGERHPEGFRCLNPQPPAWEGQWDRDTAPWAVGLCLGSCLAPEVNTREDTSNRRCEREAHTQHGLSHS